MAMAPRRYAAYIFVGGFVGKQLVWELAQRDIKEMHDKHNREAQQHLEKVRPVPRGPLPGPGCMCARAASRRSIQSHQFPWIDRRLLYPNAHTHTHARRRTRTGGGWRP